jgi:hypothetical protein
MLLGVIIPSESRRSHCSTFEHNARIDYRGTAYAEFIPGDQSV